ncbi:IucA/IucC family protein [Methylobacter sp.]|jgi:siderophore synthetase component|uniref:IucA/IucC family protein n=1 Tax=Methylobacter sp. TaxID=2051955 RepID=UPI003DA5CF5B
MRHQQNYLCRRVVDALLREDVRDMVSKGRIVPAADMPLPDAPEQPSHWLAVDHLGEGRLWIPVRPCTFMQDWALHDLPLIWQSRESYHRLDDSTAILALLRQGLDPDSAAYFDDYAGECLTAVEHGILCGQEQQRYFAEVKQDGLKDINTSWQERQLHYERLAAFLDHPLYPTARAKLGLSPDDLAIYGPEFQRPFQLRWLAVAKAIHFGPEAEASLQDLCPGFEEVGLDTRLSGDYTLLPVHPLSAQQQFDALAETHGLQGQLLLAPKPYLEVLPTLSVRTVAVQAKPGLHIKLPMAMRTLGGKNIRTIKPSTIADGHTVQSLLGRIAAQDADIAGCLLLTDESMGAHVNHLPELGYILRRYPAGLEHATVVPVAGLLAETPQGWLVVEELAQHFFADRLEDFLDAYLEATLRTHLVLWLRYGIALESNQQNSMLALSAEGPTLRLLLKDNDAPRIHGARLAARWPSLAPFVDGLQDRRIVVDDELPLAQMFTTITLQLNVAVLIEGLANISHLSRKQLYGCVRCKIDELLTELSRCGENTDLARRILLEDDWQYVKYLLTAASLKPKTATGATDVNKFYGKTGPNFLKENL